MTWLVIVLAGLVLNALVWAAIWHSRLSVQVEAVLWEAEQVIRENGS